jgi:uncharacterized protein YegP (UPF0339 family)
LLLARMCAIFVRESRLYVLLDDSPKETLEMAGKFEIKKGKTGKFRFNLKASNGQIILTSEAYDTRAAAVKGITSVKKNSANDKRFERKTAKDGSVYFVLKAMNGEPIGKSETYKTKRSLENGVASVAKNAPDAPVADAA